MFGLLSLTIEIIFWVATLAALILTVIFWHKFAEYKWNHIAARFSLIIFIQFFALASMGITVNRYGDFYDSWSDLFGAQKKLAKIAITSEALSSISEIDIQKAKTTAGGSLIFKEIIKGAQSQISNVVYVVTSPKIATQLKSPEHALGTNYQVIELFPGTPGVPQTWIGAMDGVTTMERLESANQIQPTILIIPAINVVPGQDTECMNFDGGAQVETWITSDMQTFAQKFLGIDSRPWGVFGYSTGGWCAAEAAVLHQGQYSHAAVLAGYFQPMFSLGMTKRERKFLSAKYDLVKVIKAGSTNTKLMIISSVSDKFAANSARTFMNQIDNVIPIKYIPISQGGHNIEVWKPYVGPGFQWLNQQSSEIP
jgi:enterochelin esterase-like enzyme